MNAGRIQKSLVGFAVVAASLATVAVPASAKPNTGGYQQSSEAKKQQWVDPCPGIWDQFQKDTNAAAKATDPVGKSTLLFFAGQDLKAGQMAGCDWASRVSVPQTPDTTSPPAAAAG
jgi:hypothetical protein